MSQPNKAASVLVSEDSGTSQTVPWFRGKEGFKLRNVSNQDASCCPAKQAGGV